MKANSSPGSCTFMETYLPRTRNFCGLSSGPSSSPSIGTVVRNTATLRSSKVGGTVLMRSGSFWRCPTWISRFWGRVVSNEIEKSCSCALSHRGHNSQLSFQSPGACTQMANACARATPVWTVDRACTLPWTMSPTPLVRSLDTFRTPVYLQLPIRRCRSLMLLRLIRLLPRFW